MKWETAVILVKSAPVLSTGCIWLCDTLYDTIIHYCMNKTASFQKEAMRTQVA